MKHLKKDIVEEISSWKNVHLPTVLPNLKERHLTRFSNVKKLFSGGGTYYRFVTKDGKQVKSGGGKYSERFFALFLAHILTDLGKEFALRRRKKVRIHLEKDKSVNKLFDFCLSFDGREILIEQKFNIDLVEKDIFKFYLLNRALGRRRPEAVIIIFSGICDVGQEEMSGSYVTLLEFAKREGFLDEFFVIGLADTYGDWKEKRYNSRRYDEQLGKLRTFLQGD